MAAWFDIIKRVVVARGGLPGGGSVCSTDRQRRYRLALYYTLRLCGDSDHRLGRRFRARHQLELKQRKAAP